jgi:mannosyl-oligosaccharide glucosidase
MWTRVENEQIDDKKLRHACEDDNEILGYGWDYYDVRRGGMNKVVDLGNQMNLSMEFLKYDANGIKGSWTARITANSWNRPVHARTIFYVASESSSNMICNSSKDLNENRGLLTLSGSESELGSFKIVMEPHAKFQHEAIVSSLKVPEETLWMAKGIFQVHSFDSHQVLAILYRENQSLTFTEHYIKHIANQHWDEEKACPENGNIYFFQSSFTGAFQVRHSKAWSYSYVLNPIV